MDPKSWSQCNIGRRLCKSCHANHAIKGDVGILGSGSKSKATKFRAVLTGLLGLDLPVAVVRVPDTIVPRSSDILHLEIVSSGSRSIARNVLLHAAYGSSAPAVGAAWVGACPCECWTCGWAYEGWEYDLSP
jgi:hypothetical protein